MQGSIYLFRNILNGKCYVGQTTRIQERYKDHLYLSQNNPETPFHKALAK